MGIITKHKHFLENLTKYHHQLSVYRHYCFGKTTYIYNRCVNCSRITLPAYIKQYYATIKAEGDRYSVLFIVHS